MDIDGFKGNIISLVMVALIISAFALSINAFKEDLGTSNGCENQSNYYNASTGDCCLSVDNCSVTYGNSFAYNATNEGLKGIGNTSGYLSTIGTLVGVAVLVSVVVGAFMFASR